jgi:hypothetical protein
MSTPNHKSLIGFIVLVVVVIIGFVVMAKTDVKGRLDAGMGKALAPDPKTMMEEAMAKGYRVGFLNTTKLKKVKHHNNCIIMYYTDWCGYCKQALPAFLKASHILGSMVMYAVELCHLPKGHPISSFPTIIWYHSGGLSHEVHKGPHTPNSYAKFAATP